MLYIFECRSYLGLDVHHARKALSALARYHALGIVTKQKRPDFFKTVISQAQLRSVDFDQLDEGFDGCLQVYRDNDCFAEHIKVIEIAFANAMKGKLYSPVPKEPWATITHGDFWVNNILFHKDECGSVDDVKFVDFQTYLYDSPLKDLTYFLCGSLNEETADKYFDNLINFFYDMFVQTLDRMQCEISPFLRDSFEVELKKQALNELPLCYLVIKFYVHEIEGDPKCSGELMTNVFGTKASDAYRNKLLRLVKLFERKRWF